MLPRCARLLVVGVLLLLAAWVTGQSLTDQYHLWQYLWWIPTPIVLLLAWPMLIASWVLERLSTRLGGYQLRPVLSAGVLGITIWFLFGVGHAYRVLPSSERGTIRLAYWNLAVDDRADDAGLVVSRLEPDLAVVANPRWDAARGPLLDAMRALGRPDAGSEPGDDAESPAPMHFLFSNEIALSTRGQVLRWGSARFHVGARDDSEHRGVVLFAVVRGLAPEPVNVWVVDLPSSPELWRADVMEEARSAVGSWRGPDFVPGADGKWVSRAEAEPFPDPDLVVGDFNIPRGSQSLSALVGSMDNASAARRMGFGYTWPREHAIMAIDHCFVGPSLRPVAFRAIDPGMGRHRLLVVDLRAD